MQPESVRRVNTSQKPANALLILFLFSLVPMGACLPVSQSAESSSIPGQTAPAAAQSSIASLSLSLSKSGSSAASPQIHPPLGEDITAQAYGLFYKRGDGGRQVVDDQTYLALDGDPDTIWNSGHPAPQWYAIILDQLYEVDRVEMVVTQFPPGSTTHELWIGNGSGVRTLYRKLSNLHTHDGQTLVVDIEPPLLASELMILTTHSTSFVAWREFRIFGTKPPDHLSEPKPLPLAATGIASGLNFPVQITHAGDGSGRIFVVEQQGRIKTIESGSVNERPFLDIAERVSCCQEQGMFNVAFSPSYTEDQTLFVSYTNLDGDTVISRFTSSGEPERVEPQSEKTLLVLHQPGKIHNGGRLAFGPGDGLLYIGSGDGGLWHQDSAQNPDSLLGKILRIDVTGTQQPYGVPPGNPFITVDGYRDEIWALGLRNPWGFAFDRITGDLFIPDAGQTKREEVNFQPSSSQGGENYGWLLREGTICFELWHCGMVEDMLHSPVAEYERSQGCAIVGGVVYRNNGSRDLQGLFLFADFCSGRIWGLKRPQPVYDRMWQAELVAEAGVPISSIGEDERGNVYATGYQDGILYLLEEN